MQRTVASTFPSLLAPAETRSSLALLVLRTRLAGTRPRRNPLRPSPPRRAVGAACLGGSPSALVRPGVFVPARSIGPMGAQSTRGFGGWERHGGPRSAPAPHDCSDRRTGDRPDPLETTCGRAAPGPSPSRGGVPGAPLASRRTCYLVDPASSHMLVSKIKPCMCKYELIQTVKLRMAH